MQKDHGWCVPGALHTPRATACPQRAVRLHTDKRWPVCSLRCVCLAACNTGGAYSLNTGGAATVKGTIRRLREAVDL